MKLNKNLTSLAILASSLYGTEARLLKLSPNFNTTTYLEDKSMYNLKPEYVPVEKFDFDYDANIIYADIKITNEESAFYDRPPYHGGGRLVIFDIEINNENNCKLDDENTLIDSYELITDNEDKTLMGSTWTGTFFDSILFHLNDGCSFNINAKRLSLIPLSEDPYDFVYSMPLESMPPPPGHEIDTTFYVQDGFSEDKPYEPIYRKLNGCKINNQFNDILCSFEDTEKKLRISDITLNNPDKCELKPYSNITLYMDHFYLDGKKENESYVINQGFTSKNKFLLHTGHCDFTINIGKINLPNYENYSINSSSSYLNVKFNVEEENNIYPIEDCYTTEDGKLICGKEGDKIFEISSLNIKNINACTSKKNPITNIHFYQNHNETEIVSSVVGKDDEIVLDLADGCQLHVINYKTKVIEKLSVESFPIPPMTVFGKKTELYIGNVPVGLSSPEHPAYAISLDDCQFYYKKNNVQCIIKNSEYYDIIKKEYNGIAKLVFDDMTIEKEGNCFFMNQIEKFELFYTDRPGPRNIIGYYVEDYEDGSLYNKQFIFYFSEGCIIRAEYHAVNVEPYDN